MLVTLIPGANRDDVLSTLRDLKSAAENAGNGPGPAQGHLTAYLEWATNSVRMLEHRVSAADIDRLALTRDALRGWRASYTLAVLEDLFSQPGSQGILRRPAADGTPCS